MNQITAVKADANADRPIYTGLDWVLSKTQWYAPSETTPMTYLVKEVEDGRWAARQGFRDAPGRPNIELGVYADRNIAMTACERHDYRFWASSAERAGLTCVFMGSPDHVSDFVNNLATHDREDLLDMIAGGFFMPDGNSFANTASFFEATKAGLKQERSGAYTATLTIAAQDLPIWLMQVAPGANLVIGAAKVDSGTEDEWLERASNALKRSFALVQDNAFHAWFGQKYDNWGLIQSAMQKTSEEVEDAVSETLRRVIGCPSRRELATSRDAVARLEKIDREFYLDMSRGFHAIS
jgi:hypothetical protein